MIGSNFPCVTVEVIMKYRVIGGNTELILLFIVVMCAVIAREGNTYRKCMTGVISN